MENIITAVEGAIGSAEAEAKKIETEAVTEVKDVEADIKAELQAAAAIYAKIKDAAREFITTIKSDRAKTVFVMELEALVTFVKQPSAATLIDPAAPQAVKDAEEDALVIEGAFSRAVHTVSALIHRLWQAI